MHIILIILFFTTVLFVSGKLRYDIVALIALMAAVIFGVVKPTEVYSGLSNPAVITVACVMIISQAITDSGILNPISRGLNKINRFPAIHIGALTLLSAILSAFMNNVGALGLMMPIALQTARETKRSPSILLMPIALGSALGGLTTIIGTPPNLLIANYYAKNYHKTMAMFDFSKVGVLTALVGILFISFIGWRLLPRRKKEADSNDLFDIQDYITELKVTNKSSAIDTTVSQFEKIINADYAVIGIIRNARKRLVVRSTQVIQENDIIIIEASSDVLEKLINVLKLQLVADQKVSKENLKQKDISLIECVIPQGSVIEGRSSQQLRLRSRYQVNLLAISRQGQPFKDRLRHVNLKGGDVVLLQGSHISLQESISRLGILPLVERKLKVSKQKHSYLALLIFIAAIIPAAFFTKLCPVEVCFGGAVLAMLLTNIIPARKVYNMIDWPIIILLAAMIPVGQALQHNGSSQIAILFTNHIRPLLSSFLSPEHVKIAILGLIMLITMTLSDFMNNAATAIVMAPIAAGISLTLNCNPETFLMGIAVAASCSFLTPIGHQNNTLVMGPGGYKFSDYIRIGLPLEILVLSISIPLLITFFPITLFGS
jgi:di/tricarboxylate transporter